MLKNIDPMLNADVLYALRSMGHADTLVVCDTNFPAAAIAQETALGELLRMENVSSARAIQAITSVMPLDTAFQPSVGRMEVMGKPDEVLEVQAEVQAVVDAVEGQSTPMYGIERFKFYDMAREAYCVITTGERRFYGCFLLSKGVIAPEDG